MEDNKILKFVYTFFVGLLLALFVGFGISTFYPSPNAPVYPADLNSYGKELNADQVILQRQYDKSMEQYLNDLKPYNRNVSIITLGVAVIYLVTSLIFEKRIKIISTGVMFGSLFTLVYSIGRGVASEDSKYVFVVITISLVLTFYIGYHRFVRIRSYATKTSKGVQKLL